MEEYLWCEKYRPKTVGECILPPDMKQTFQSFVDGKNIPNLLLTGRSGVGKTTVAMAMLNELGCDYIMINGSLNGNIDTLRNDIQNFASSVSFAGGRKYVILDEADHLTNAVQPALRNFMEQFSSNCGFILTANFKERIIEPLHSRCSVIDFVITNKDKAKLAIQFMKRVLSILDQEAVTYDKAVVAKVIEKYFPDWRRVINELQRYAHSGAIDAGILANIQEASIELLVSHMKGKNFTELRKWCGENNDTDWGTMYRKFYDLASKYITPQSIPMLVLLIGKYQYQHSLSIDPEINFAAFLVECMIELTFT